MATKCGCTLKLKVLQKRRAKIWLQRRKLRRRPSNEPVSNFLLSPGPLPQAGLFFVYERAGNDVTMRGAPQAPWSAVAPAPAFASRTHWFSTLPRAVLISDVAPGYGPPSAAL